MDKINEKILKADDLLNKNKPLEAVLFLKKAEKEFFDNPYFYYLLGVARTKCGLFSLAKRSLEKANELQPNNAENLRSLGWAKIMLGEIESGRKDLRYSINLNLTNPMAYADLTMSYMNCFDFDEAIAWFERAIALNPKDEFMADNCEFAREMKESFLRNPEAKRQKIKKEKLSSETQKETHLFILNKNFNKDGYGEEEAQELKEELELSGLAEKMLVYKDDVEGIMGNETKKDILKKRGEIEKQILSLIKEYKSRLTLDDIRKIIYQEKSHHELDKILKEFDRGQNFEEINEILQLINNAWNYFPHKSLNGLSPAEMVLEYKEKNNKKSKK